MSKIEEVAQAVQMGRVKLVPGIVQEALDEGNAPIDILNKGMIDAMTAVGERFKNNEIYVPEMLVAAKAMKKGVEILKPHLAGDASAHTGKMVMGTVYSDLHDIGKNLVIMMIESAGYEVVDLGVDVPVETFMEAANDPEVTVVGVSALLTTTMPAMKETVAALNTHPRRSEFTITIHPDKHYEPEVTTPISTAPAISQPPGALSKNEDGSINVQQDGSRYVPQARDVIRCDDGTNTPSRM